MVKAIIIVVKAVGDATWWRAVGVMTEQGATWYDMTSQILRR